MKNLLALLAFAMVLSGCASPDPVAAPDIHVDASPAHVRDTLAALMMRASQKTGSDLRLARSTDYSMIYDGPQGSGSPATPSGYAEVQFTMAPSGSGTEVVGRTYDVAPRGNILAEASMRTDTTARSAGDFLIPMLSALKRCAEDPGPKSCPWLH